MLVSPRGSFSPGLPRRVIAFGAIATGVCVMHHFNAHVVLNVGLYEVAGAVIALILAFRTNTSYNRFWEGRTLWGGIVNASRNLGRIVSTHAKVDAHAAREFATWVVVFAHATRRSLRDEPEHPEISRLLNEDAAVPVASHPHLPSFAASQLSNRLATMVRTGALDPMMAARAEEEVCALVNLMGGCERIRKTPTPLGYVLLLRRGTALYLATLPLCIVKELGFIAPVVTMMAAYCVLMVEALGEELDNPFGHDPNDLPLTRICDTIEKNLLGSSSLDLVLSSTASSAYED